MRIVIALGGNALLRRGEPMTAGHQRANVRVAAAALARVAAQHELVISHGNGPQVGLLALQGSAYKDVEAYPLDVLGAETQGMIGYLVEQEVGNLLPEERPLATILTMVEVDPADPAFGDPTKFVGPVYDEATATALAAEKGWSVKPDGAYWRRVVPSPRPKRIFEIRPMRWLLDQGAVVICAGGGGIPTMYEPGADRILTGVEAVIDKDLASSLLARELDADLYVMATDVDGVYRDWGTADAGPDRPGDPAELEAMDLPAGSMGPKVAAAAEFVAATGKRAAIGSLEEIDALVDGTGGTQVVATRHEGGVPMTTFGVHSEVGKLRQVIVHRPELSPRTPHADQPRRAALRRCALGRARPVGARPVRGPHARARRRGPVRQDLLGEALAASEAARQRIIEVVAAEAVVGPSLVEDVQAALTALAPEALARHLIGGLTVEESGLDLGRLRNTSLIGAAIDDPSMFVLPPLPNTLFTRDSSCWIYGGVSINPMFWPARRREAYNMAAIYRAHPRVPGPDVRLLVSRARRRRALQRRGFRPGHPRGRRCRDHREGHGRDRDVRADVRPDDRADRPGPLRQGRGRTRHRGGHDQGPRAHAPGHGLHPARPGQGDRLSDRSSRASGRSAFGQARSRGRSTCARTRTSSRPSTDALGVKKLHVVETGGDATSGSGSNGTTATTSSPWSRGSSWPTSATRSRSPRCEKPGSRS